MEIPDKYVYGFLTAVALLFIKMYLSASGFFGRGKGKGNGNGSESYRKMTLADMYEAMQAVHQMHADVAAMRDTNLPRIERELDHLGQRVKWLEGK